MSRTSFDPPPMSTMSAGLAEGVLHFLNSLGKRSEAELYLRLFRGLSRGRFALLAPTRGVLEEHAGTVAEQLGFLRDLGLFPSLLLGSVDSADPDLVAEFEGALRDVDLVPRLHFIEDATSFELPQVTASFDEIPVYCLKEPTDVGLARVVGKIAPRKVIFLRRAGGLGPHRGPRVELGEGHFLPASASGIGVINLRNDVERLRRADFIGADDKRWLARSELVLEGHLGRDLRATVSVASPLSILRELFTVRGEGTLIKLGSAVTSVTSYAEANQSKLAELLENAFSRSLLPHFWEREPLRIYYEQDYRGGAFLEPGLGAAFLSKFAVLPVAQGEGLGQDLWWALSKHTPAVYWRARVSNPINAWYRTVCDGMHRADEWIVYWRGVSSACLPGLIEDALARPEDFARK